MRGKECRMQTGNGRPALREYCWLGSEPLVGFEHLTLKLHLVDHYAGRFIPVLARGIKWGRGIRFLRTFIGVCTLERWQLCGVRFPPEQLL